MLSLQIHYVPALVLISVLISMLASYTAMLLADRRRLALTALARRLWLLGGSLAMGSGIWSMHYLGMLAVKLPVAVYYYWPVVVLSGMMAVGASAVALTVTSAESPTRKDILLGSVLMAVGIGGMHYTGMAAMRSTAMEHYNPWVVALSVVAALAFSWTALQIAFVLRKCKQSCSSKLRLAGACLMGLGIAAMHYIAMAGVTFEQDSMPLDLRWTIRVHVLGECGVALVTGLVLVGALVTAALDQRRLEGLTRAHSELEQAQQALQRSENELREANLLLNELVLRDGLTGIHNRRQLDAMLAVEWRRAAREKRSIALLMIDVDHFKAYNDCYGHLGGDACLRDIARVLSDQPRRAHDCVARFGGEEFAVVLPGSGEADALLIAERMRRAVEALCREHRGSSTGRHVTVSIGVASLQPAPGQPPAELLAEADAALYLAKEAGRNCVVGASTTVAQPVQDQHEASVTS